MPPETTPKAKPAKAWAIVSPKGKIIEISLTHSVELYHSAYFNDAFTYKTKGKTLARNEDSHLTIKEIVLREGYRCIPIQISPLK